MADEPAAPVVTVPTDSEFAGPVAPVAPVNPVSPRGIASESVWFGAVPVIVAVAVEPAAPVVTVPMARLFAGPVFPRGIESESV